MQSAQFLSFFPRDSKDKIPQLSFLIKVNLSSFLEINLLYESLPSSSILVTLQFLEVTFLTLSGHLFVNEELRWTIADATKDYIYT